jgi:signal recognition particle subunit SRP54
MKQMETMNKLGSMESILKMIPGMGGVLRQVGDLNPAKDEMKKMRFMCDSMTIAERQNHKLLNPSRRERIAKGSGRTVKELNEFIQKFEQMQKMMSSMMGMMKGGMPNLPGLGGGMPGMPGAPMKGFRQQPGQSGKTKVKGKNPFGKRFF